MRREAVAVIGGGWAGLACAVELAAAGRPVTLFEAARQLGGRARRVDWNGIALDNGQHILIGAYQETLRLLERVGSAHLLERRPLEFDQPPGFRLALPRLPAPLHVGLGLARARGLAWRDKRAAARFIQTLKRQGYRLPADTSVSDLLARQGQTPALVHHLWEPICLAALNTPLDQASAQVFCNVLRDSLGSVRAASDLLLPRADLGRLLPDAATAYLAGHGGEVRLGCRIEGIERTPRGYRLTGSDCPFGHVVCATSPARLPALLAGLPELELLRRRVAAYAYQPIETLWLRFERSLELPFPMLGLDQGPGQWLFDRRELAPGLASVVISAEGPHRQLTKPALLAAVLEQTERAVGALPELRDHLSVLERRATFAAVPGLVRPATQTALPGLYLAGDHIQSDYPATLEAAVRSGVAAARAILAQAETTAYQPVAC